MPGRKNNMSWKVYEHEATTYIAPVVRGDTEVCETYSTDLFWTVENREKSVFFVYPFETDKSIPSRMAFKSTAIETCAKLIAKEKGE
jgi:hypothetical protein